MLAIVLVLSAGTSRAHRPTTSAHSDNVSGTEEAIGKPALWSTAADASAPRREVLSLAMRAYACGRARGYFDQPLLTIIDYSRPSTERRLWVVDTRSRQVLFHELVAHGRNSGENLAVAFSNVPGSLQSSLGLFRTGDTYRGRHGESLRLFGLEPGFNDRADERAIVMHGAQYVSTDFANEHGRLGRSWGCPALSADVCQEVIDRIRGGSALFAYYPDAEWLRSSTFLNCGV